MKYSPPKAGFTSRRNSAPRYSLAFRWLREKYLRLLRLSAGLPSPKRVVAAKQLDSLRQSALHQKSVKGVAALAGPRCILIRGEVSSPPFLFMSALGAGVVAGAGQPLGVSFAVCALGCPGLPAASAVWLGRRTCPLRPHVVFSFRALWP